MLAPEETTIRWFGPQRPFRHTARTQVPVPVGQPCTICERPLAIDDQGLSIPHLSRTGGTGMSPYHHECFLESILGPDILKTVVDDAQDTDVTITVNDD